MNALALLCTLHADGPSTLHALRTAGCQSLLDLQECSSNELAQYLELSVASAERLQREAELLGMRLSPLEPEASVEPRSKLSLPPKETTPAELTPAEPPADLPEETPDEVEALVEEEPEPPRVIKPLPPALAGSRANRSWFSATRIPQAAAQARGEFGRTAITEEPQLERAANPPAPVLEFEELSEEAPIESTACRGLEAARIAVETLATESVAPSEVSEVQVPAVEAPSPAVTYVTEPEPELARIAPEFPELAEAILRLGEAAGARAGLPALTRLPEVTVEAVEVEAVAIEPVEVETAEPESTGTATPLALGQPDGIDSELLEALRAAGISTAEALVEASGLELSRVLSIPFTRLLELQLAAQHLFRRSNTLVPQKPRSRRALDRASDPSGSITKKRRHTDSYSAQPTATGRDAESLAQEARESELTDAFDAPPSGNVGGPFA